MSGVEEEQTIKKKIPLIPKKDAASKVETKKTSSPTKGLFSSIPINQSASTGLFDSILVDKKSSKSGGIFGDLSKLSDSTTSVQYTASGLFASIPLNKEIKSGDARKDQSPKKPAVVPDDEDDSDYQPDSEKGS